MYVASTFRGQPARFGGDTLVSENSKLVWRGHSQNTRLHENPQDNDTGPDRIQDPDYLGPMR